VRRLRRRNASACTRALQSTGARARDETMAILPHASTHRQLVGYSGESSRGGPCGRRGHWSFLPFCLAFLDGDRTRRKPIEQSNRYDQRSLATFFLTRSYAHGRRNRGRVKRVGRPQRREIYLPFNGLGACVSLFTAPLTVKASLGQGAREPSARTGPDANILPQDRYAARGRLCGLPWTPRRIPCSISIRARARTHTLASGGSCIGKLHGASRAPWRTPNGASACDCVDALATGPLAQLINERPTFSDGGSVQQGCKWSSR
jgi:hypothetical protein